MRDGHEMEQWVDLTTALNMVENDWEQAAAESILRDHVTYNLPGDTEKIKRSMTERINLAHSIISIANAGILSAAERERGNIQANTSIDLQPSTSGPSSQISLSQAELGGSETAQNVSGLLEHQAMSVRMERYMTDEGGHQVPEPFLDPRRLTREEILAAYQRVKKDLPSHELNDDEVLSEYRNSGLVGKILYSEAVTHVHGQKPLLKHALAQRASTSAIFIASPPSVKRSNPETYTATGLDTVKPGSHELRTPHSIPGAAIEYVLVPRHMQAFAPLIQKHLHNKSVSIRYVDGTHQVKVSWQGMLGLPQVSFDIDSPNWAATLQKILDEEERILAHVTRPLKEPVPLVSQEFMKSKITQPLSPHDQVLANKMFGRKKAAELFTVKR